MRLARYSLHRYTQEPMTIKNGAICLSATAGNAARIDWTHPALSTIQGDMT